MNINLIGISPHSLKNSSVNSHNEWEIVLNLEGEGTTVIGEHEYNFFPGTIICQPPNIPHCKTSQNTFKDIYIQVNDFINPTNETVPIFVDDEEKSFETLMFLALRIFHKKESNYISIINSLSHTMYQLLLGWNSSIQKDDNVELFKNELILNFTNPEFEISNAMKKTAYCIDHFRRCFKKNTGTTPISYLINLRVEYAKKLLKQKYDSKMSISQIAFLSGFYDATYFSRMFKSKVGITPQDYAMAQKNGCDFALHNN